MRSRAAAAVLIGLSLSLTGGGIAAANPLPDSLPGTTTAPSAAPSQAPAPESPAATAPVTPPVPVSLIGPKTRSSLVRQYQGRLRVRGQRIKVTGRFDKATERATRRLQKKMGLPPNGLVDASFLTSLGIKMRGVAGANAPLPDPASNAGVVQVAMQYVGVPYRWGGATPAGFDCSGLSMFSYKAIGKSIPRTTWGIWGALPKVPFNQLAPGDMVFFSNLGHMGIYIGDGNFIHAPRTGEFVRVQALATRLHNYVGAVRP